MKKYTLFLLAFSFIVGLFAINANLVNAVSTTYPAEYEVYGCNVGDKFSRKTGEPCGTMKIPSTCAPGDLFSSVTGKPCKVVVEEKCYITAELKMGSRGEEVKTFQQKLRDEGFLSGKADGVYGKMTSEAANRYYKIRPCYPNPSSSVVISGVKGPQSLAVNEQGNWTVSAYNKDGGELSYSVVWGDEAYTSPMYPAMMEKEIIHQNATFSHIYSQAGTYKPTFTVTSPNTIRCIQAPCPGNGGRSQTSLSVKVGKISLLKVCPEEWIQNRMPGIVGDTTKKEYYIYKGARRELSEFDASWVKTNCSITPEVAY